MTTGNIRVELFNAATGEKTQEVQDHNFISEGVRHLLDERMRHLFTQSRLTGGEENYLIRDPFEKMELTTATHPEDPLKEWLPRGKIIGEASSISVNQPTTPTRGSYNRAESATSRTHVKMVFDFPSDRGNGTFQSIYFMPDQVTFPTFVNDSAVLVPHPNLGKTFRHRGQLWGTASGKLLKLADDYTIQETMNVSFSDVAAIGDYLYFVWSDPYVFRMLIDGFPTATRTQIDTPGISTSAIATDEITGKGYVGGSGSIYEVMDPKTFELRRIVGGSLSTPFLAHDDLLYSTASLVDAPTGQVRTNLFNGAIRIDEDDEYILIYHDANNLRRVRKIGMGSRCLLPTPITKDNTQVMKITYEFTLPPFPTKG